MNLSVNKRNSTRVSLVIEKLKEFSKGNKLSGLNWNKLRDSGRNKYSHIVEEKQK